MGAPVINLLFQLVTIGLNYLWIKCCTSKNLTQVEANMLIEYPPFDIENNVSDLMNLILSCLYYTPLVPAALPLCCLGLFVSYFVSKLHLAWFSKMPESDFGSQLTL